MSRTSHAVRQNDSYMTLFRLGEKMILVLAELHDVEPEDYLSRVRKYPHEALDILATQHYIYYKKAWFSDKLTDKLRLNKGEFKTLVEIVGEIVESSRTSGMSVTKVLAKIRKNAR